MELLTMARRYKKRSRKTYKRRQSSGGMSIANMAKAGFNMAKKIVRLINVEKKHYTTGSIQQADYNGTIVDLCDPVQGHDQDERSGDSIKPLHMTIRGFLYNDATAGTVQFLRVIIFRYKDENGVALTPSMVLDQNYVGTTSSIICGKNWDKKFHSKILYDKLFTLGYSAGGTNQDANIPASRTFKFSKKLFGHINWGDSTSTEEGGGIYMLLISPAASSSDGPGIQWVSRVTYTDN